MAKTVKRTSSPSFDLFVRVTVVPIWKKPPRTVEEVWQRADLTEAFLKKSSQIADELRELVIAKVRP